MPQGKNVWCLCEGSLDWLKLPLPVLVLSLCSSSFFGFSLDRKLKMLTWMLSDGILHAFPYNGMDRHQGFP